jgi:hypothetical protein
MKNHINWVRKLRDISVNLHTKLEKQMSVLGHASRTKARTGFLFISPHIPPYGELSSKNRVLQICFLHIQQISLWKELESRGKPTV